MTTTTFYRLLIQHFFSVPYLGQWARRVKASNIRFDRENSWDYNFVFETRYLLISTC